MNETTLPPIVQTGLKVIVERAVRPVSATFARKKRMREELLSHVTNVFEQERERLGDETAALTATEQRFGDPREVAAQFEATVPVYDRPLFRAERMTQIRAGESSHQHAVRCAGFVAVFLFPVTFAAMLAVRLVAEEDYRLSSMVGLWLLMTAESAVVVYLFTRLAHAMRKALFGTAKRSLARATGIGLVACLVAIAATFVLHLAVLGDAGMAAEHVRQLAVETPAVLLIGPIVVGLAWLVETSRRDSCEWSELAID